MRKLAILKTSMIIKYISLCTPLPSPQKCLTCGLDKPFPMKPKKLSPYQGLYHYFKSDSKGSGENSLLRKRFEQCAPYGYKIGVKCL